MQYIQLVVQYKMQKSCVKLRLLDVMCDFSSIYMQVFIAVNLCFTFGQLTCNCWIAGHMTDMNQPELL